jgi:hypothetical protein
MPTMHVKIDLLNFPIVFNPIAYNIYLTNYGKKNSINKHIVSTSCQDLLVFFLTTRVSAISAGRRDSKNTKIFKNNNNNF